MSVKDPTNLIITIFFGFVAIMMCAIAFINIDLIEESSISFYFPLLIAIIAIIQFFKRLRHL